MPKRILPENLTNVFGTAMRILKSKNKIGIFQMVLYVFFLLMIPFDFLLSGIQWLCIHKKEHIRLPLIFISGYSRSGTTLLYQLLARSWNVEYINNIVILFPRSYILMNRLFRFFNKKRPGECLSFYGVTGGLTGTNDAAQLFYRWIPRCHYVEGVPIPPRNLLRMRRFLAGFETFFKQPLMTKNCNNYLIFEQLAEYFPSAYFIFVKRNPAKIIQSTFKAREFIQGSSTRSWEFSLKETRTDGATEDGIKEIALNVKHAFQLMEGLQQRIGKKRLQIISYEALCQDPQGMINRLSATIFKKKPDVPLDEANLHFNISAGPAMENEETARIRTVVEQMFPVYTSMPQGE